MKRRIAIKKISGITKSKDAKSLEFVLHVPEEYDYRFAANRRDIIINYIKKIFLFHQKANLPIFGVHVSNLKDFTQTRVEKMARMPGEKVRKRPHHLKPQLTLLQNRLWEEDLVQEKGASKYSSSSKVSTASSSKLF